jgi:hypothetical protein
MNSTNKMIRLMSGFILLIALLAFQGSSTGKGCFSCEDYTAVTFTNGTATKIALVLSGPMSSAGTIEPGGSYGISLPAGMYNWIAYSDYVKTGQGNEYTGDTVATGHFGVTDTKAIAITIK